MNSLNFSKRISLGSVALLLLFAPLSAQNSDEEDVFELSPFVVDAKGDVGYATQNTLAGSRLNTNLKDVAAPLEVFTKEFIDDIGALTLEDALAYHSNAQEDLGDENSSMQQDYKMQAQVRTRFKVRGMSQTRSRDYFAFTLPMDLFSSDRIDASRGPNSILFGIGNAGGVSNTSSKQARLGDDATTLNFRVADYDAWRVHVDHNQVLIEDKFAVRLNMMQQDGKAWYANGRDEKEGLQFATRLKLSDRTSFRTDFEYGTMGDMATRTYPVANQAYYWDLADRPTFDISTVRTTANLGANGASKLTQTNPNTGEPVTIQVVTATRNDTADRFTFIDNDGTFFSSSNLYTMPGNIGTPQLGQDVIYGTMINGPSAERNLTYKTWSAFLEHRFSKQFNVELAYNHQDSNWYAMNFGNEASMLGEASNIFYRVAPATAKAPGATTVNSIAHNYGGLYYYEDDPRRERRYGEDDNLRLTASYELKTDRVGTHRFAAMLARNDSSGGTHIRGARVLTDKDGALVSDPENANYIIRTRHYITDESDPADFRNADISAFPTSVTDPFTGNTYQTGFATISDNFSESSIDSKLISMQNYLFDSRLVTTFGYRLDDAQTVAYGNREIGADGLPTGNTFRDTATNEFKYNKADISRDVKQDSATRTLGAVYHLSKHVSLTFNDSENNGPPYGSWSAPNTTEAIDVTTLRGTADNEPWAPTGEGRDFGLKFDLMDSKVFVTANYFKTRGTGSLTSRDTGLDNRFADIIRSLYGDQPFNETPGTGLIGLLQLDSQGNIIELLDANGQKTGTPDYQVIPGLIPAAMPLPDFRAEDSDFETEGYELNLTANLTDNINVRMGYSYTTRRTFDRWAMASAFSEKMREWVNSGRDFDASLLARLPIRRVNGFEDAEGTSSVLQDSSGRYYMFANDVLDFDIDQWIANDLENAQEGFGQRQHKANIWARYQFRDGALKGFEVAGGLRYQSGAEIGYRQYYDETGSLTSDKGDVQNSSALFSNDLALIYKTKADWVIDGARLRLQLNVQNVFDDSDYDPARYRGNSFGEQYVFRYYVPTPRQTSLSASISF